MFNFFKPKSNPTTSNQELTTLVLHLTGLHCSSCAVNIDLALEDLPGVKAKTNYAKSETKIEFDPSKTTLDQIHFAIRDLGYNVE
ncbi:TPA: heavy metal transporter [Candidatus Collierbacteria bacterium]|uniref:Copper-exporting ATPase n=1 Tax=Candidatus Collierbacteria bacterium GW2011_GWB2_44_22 TaxID=1618387 RepID=A0A0G1HVU0_9BACT|nr:MAG: Copper-exporting ATPase [Candidatus Collierbacteria bacterium GW2011_GWA2_44_13]KKT51060.1 MAG: Copper-exporting ATPase [Candidatus Collierbacteria bacterium GW2011_GWB2_44_22]KKT62074.1 MAG: Copper-exporting ATPase [Candidatus Collierbacteria bacterium GW2011_GWD1_44_27]KKT64609.1 MAG: Copper-exporting ATPase [Candidatus Collierbacteria bacterium GW2011_GWC2_44_30]KKT68433.1 MAG: Copper-exporting ATPase [Microgenomates group bacterium GW2011_GWC1_44_37]KKT88048.1 MAG: Copper-exporting